jgi:hypothetical protein
MAMAVVIGACFMIGEAGPSDPDTAATVRVCTM